jgi:7-keto-8-aminopelargonate synthetase-like enzyme
MAVMQSPPDAETVIDGRRYLYFGGTAYLGLQGHPEVIRAACTATERYGLGSATTRAWFGDTPPVLDVERLAARLFGADDAFYYASGFMSNHVLLGALRDVVHKVFLEERSHYSLIEAAQSLRLPTFTFAHRDPASLHAALKAQLRSQERALVVSDGVFPVLGTIAPVADYARLLADYPGSILAIDDAHALGVLGELGRGTYEYTGLLTAGGNTLPAVLPQSATPNPLPITLLFCGTLSKALGGFGGIIPGTQAFIGWLKSRSHYFDGASGPAVPVAAASAKALELVLAQPALRQRLADNVRLAKAGLRWLGFSTDETPVPIIGLRIGTGENMARIQRELAERGIMIAHAATYSGVGPGGVLRIAIFATHTPAMIEQLCDALRKVL